MPKATINRNAFLHSVGGADYRQAPIKLKKLFDEAIKMEITMLKCLIHEVVGSEFISILFCKENQLLYSFPLVHCS